MKRCLILPIFLEAAGPNKKEYLKTASCHVKGFAKAAGVDSFFIDAITEFPAALRNSFTWLLAAFRNSFTWLLAAFRTLM
jgi:hypothetical protein